MLIKRFAFISATVFILASGSSAVFAEVTPELKFKVQVTVKKACAVTPGVGNIVFDLVDAGSEKAQSKSTDVVVRCSKTTPYQIGLLPGNNDTAGAGKMGKEGVTNPTPDQSIAYQLHQRATAVGGGGLAVWGNVAGAIDGAGVNTRNGTGTGKDATHKVTATVANNVWNVEPGTYFDDVRLVVTY